MIWYYLILSYLSLFALGISDNVRGPLFPELLQHFQVSDTQGAFFYAMSSLMGFIGSYSVRFILRRWHRLRTLQFSMLLMALGLIFMGLAQSFAQLLVAAALFGFSLGTVGVVQNVLVSLGSPLHLRERILAGLHATYGAASLLAPLLVAAFFSAGGSWRVVFIGVSLVPLAVLGFAVFRRSPQEAAIDHGLIKPKVQQSRRVHLGQLYLAVTTGFYVIAEIMVSSRLALFERREFGVDLQHSSYDLTGFFICLLVGRLFFSYYRLRGSVRRVLSLSLLLSAAAIALGLTVNPFFLMLSGLFMAPFFPMSVAYISHHHREHLDSAMSYAMALQSLMLVAMHAGIGRLTDAYGISRALWVGPVALVAAFLLLNSYERLFRNKE